jgi:catechol 2,3-dioxygenase
VFARVEKAGGRPLDAPAALTTPGAGYGFAFRDPEGREVVVVAETRLHADGTHLNDRPYRLSHVVFNSTALDAAAKFFADALGFKVRDRTRKASFMGCNADHHCIAFTNRGNTAISHVAYELPSLDAELRGCGRLKKAGLKIEWGVGRHGTGENVFAYFVDPNNFAIEYTTEMQQVDDATYVPGTPDTIGRPSHSDLWGFADPPTERFLHALEGHSQRQTKVA